MKAVSIGTVTVLPPSPESTGSFEEWFCLSLSLSIPVNFYLTLSCLAGPFIRFDLTFVSLEFSPLDEILTTYSDLADSDFPPRITRDLWNLEHVLTLL